MVDLPKGQVTIPKAVRDELDRLDFAEAYLVAHAEATGVGAVMSFDRAIDRVSTVDRIAP
jgi:predicted nucleic acid-binding protein